MILRVKKLREDAVLPSCATEESAGYDLYATEDMTIEAGENGAVHTGIAVELVGKSVSDKYAILIFARSGLACKRGLAPANCVGVVDEDYRGEVIVCLHNSTSEVAEIQKGERVAQLIVTPIVKPWIEAGGTLSDTTRGAGGFGSTGTK